MKRRQITNCNELEWVEVQEGARFASRRKQLGAAAGGQKLGCSLLSIPPGKCAWPMHYHCANEEAIYILSGSGTLRLGEDRLQVGVGDYLAFPVGPANAHQLENTGLEPLEYLCFSTMIDTDVMGYPDSGKIGFTAGAAPGGNKKDRTHFSFFEKTDEVPYWKGEI